ncbi:ervatamin-C-like [Hordeum vulgare subsp. vulgare]|uniref:Uncharacterized protein n=1 Tax=Hordeum vulgare subsp. vulgare TaxID=112509 RepID=A0A8I6WXF8_HORVV|nr:ervatamin-C-like [Hordeum vulgare subsp. vulgare]
MAFSPGGTRPVIPILVLLTGGLFAAFPAASGGRVDAGDMLMMDRFRQWQATHNRSYLSAEERLRRFEVYRTNVEYIDATNRRGGLTYELGENQFADLTGEEFLARYAGGHTGSAITTAAEADGLWSSGGGDGSLEAVPPASVDWRAKGAVTPVKNQGSQCYSCWAFSAVATMESLYFIKTGKLVALSEQQLVDCDKYDGGCNKGYYHRAFQWIMENGGITTAAQYPYKAVRGACSAAKPAVTITGHLAVAKNELALQSAVARQPIGVAIEVPSSMQFYKSGVFSAACGIQMSHAVVTVGYGADASGLKYWLVKNSWGQTWGEAGYIRMRRDVGGGGLCGIALDTAYPTM